MYKRQFQTFLSFFKDRLRNNVRDAHNKAIADTHASPKKRAEKYEGLSFHIASYDGCGIILPDTCLLFVTKNGISPTVTKDDKVGALVLPVSSDKAIIGSAFGTFMRDRKTMNSMLASVAYQAFVAPVESLEYNALRRRIRSNARIISESEFQEIIRSI